MRCGFLSAVLLVLCACQAPERSARTLAPGTSIEAQIKSGEAHDYVLSLKTGQYAGIVVDQRGVDVAVTLHNPNGLLLTSVDSPQGSRVPEPIPVIASTSGIYRVEVVSPEQVGSYSVRVDALRPATAEDRTFVRAERLLSLAETLRRRDDRLSRKAAAIKAREAAGFFTDPSRKADAFYTLGSALYLLDDNAGSRGAYGRALALFRETGREREAGKALNALGRSWRQEPERALELYREALALNRRLGDRQQEATTLQNLGKIHQSLGETEAALAHYERALPIWRELRVKSEEAGTLLALGDLYQRMGDPTKALDLLSRAIALFEAAGSSGDAASALTTLGDAQARAGRVREALGSLSRALAIQRRNGNRREEAQALNSIGCCHLLLGRHEEARRPLAAARSIFRQIGDRSAEAVALVNLGLADEQRPRQAIAAFTAAMPSLISHDYEALALLGLARAHRRLGDLASARKEAEGAIEHIESLRGKSADLSMRASFLASKQDYYGFYVDLLMDLHRREPGAGYDARALAASEQARARSLLDMLAGSGATQARPLTVPEIQREVADGGTLILQYTLGRERSFLWALTPDSLTSFDLPPRATIEEAARRVYGLLSTAPQTLARERTRQEMAELSRMLLAPASGLLEGKRLVVVPDGALHYVPFAALPSPGSGEPLVIRHEVVTLPSSSSLAAIRREARPRASATLAVVADPVFASGGKLGPLPFSREEAEALLALAPPAGRMGALGLDASRKTVLSGRLSGYRLVHFATHGILDADHPELSGLLLSDGFLRAHEIYRLSLPADLVVLSACRTALGREMRGEGLIGLTRGFLHAGARGVLVSLWEVEDRATAELMRRFYREMLQAGRPPAAALRAAQASLRRERAGKRRTSGPVSSCRGTGSPAKPFDSAGIYPG